MTEAVAKGPEEAIAQSEAHINDYLFRGGADTEAEDVGVGEKFGVGELIKAAWANAKATERAWLERLNRGLQRNPSLLLFCRGHNHKSSGRRKLWGPSRSLGEISGNRLHQSPVAGCFG
jgi:hypothetical protein